ncbi:MAG TPA: hypothetical protein ENN90_02245 [Mariniphaga anaerophila]|uniref:Uncharacterized protein n=1 Tax=Mariniphaga anaerophila TaxID=1484053 RepID=A0A831LKN9_9BACT|nr:hypothetical protein [Mariniphaga anaerophila]
MSKQVNSSRIAEIQANSKKGYTCILIFISSFICFAALAQNQSSSEQVKIDVTVGNSFYIDITVGDFYIDVGVGDSFYDIGVTDLFNQLGVSIGAQPESETGVKFDKGYIPAQLKDVQPEQRFAGFIKDAGKLEKTCGIQGVKNGSRVEILCNEKGKFRLTFPDQLTRSKPADGK